ncbi:MAG: ExbD/TolR family protein [Brevinematia bacterium]
MKIRGKRIAAEIPTASQSDIAFLLIIFFLVTASFAARSGITLGFPKKDALPKEVYVKEIGEIKITRDSFFIGGNRVAESYLEKSIEDFEYRKIIVYVEKGVPYGRVVKIISYLQKKDAEVSLRVIE